MDEETASDYAYMAMEAVAWQNILYLMEINGKHFESELNMLSDNVLRAAAVDQTVKVSAIDIDV